MSISRRLSPSYRRCEAIHTIEALLDDIRERVARGPVHRLPSNEDTAKNFEVIRDKLREVQAAAIYMENERR